VVLLVFNLMPVYPLDGGQILRSLLWYVIGRAKSLFVASIIGFIGLAGLLFLAAWAFFGIQDMKFGGWVVLIAFFVASRSWGGLREAWRLARVAKLPRREGFACPACKSAPPTGELWRCGKCGKPFDTFQSLATCPHCGAQYNATQCLDCGASSPIDQWQSH
jgi:DNA-directed RNA polymerase subunit RPC12/RpoP